MSARTFGATPDGAAIRAFDLADGAIAATVITYGASLADLAVNGRSVLLGFADGETYAAHKAHFGSIAGRCANRIAGGRFSLDGIDHQLSRNDGPNHLHGGANGFGQLNWTVVESDARSVTLSLVSPDGDQGYPGEVHATCRYLVEGGGLTIDLRAVADRPTLVNLAAHGYFNLDGSQTILDHRLTIAADSYLPVDGELMPTGEIRPVAQTPFDFRAQRPIRNDAGQTYDHNFALAPSPSAEPRFAARLESPGSELTMELWTTEPGVQFYDGNFLPVPERLRDGRQTRKHGALCLEPQRFPDAVHHPAFPGAVLRPGETYRQVTQYRFPSA